MQAITEVSIYPMLYIALQMVLLYKPLQVTPAKGQKEGDKLRFTYYQFH